MNTDEQVRQGFASLAEEVRVEPGAWARIERGIRRRARARLGVTVAAIVVVVSSASVLVRSARDETGSFVGPARTPAQMVSYVHPGGSWSWRYPAHWDIQRFRFGGRVSLDSVRVATFDLGPDVTAGPNGRVDPDDPSRFPEESVMVQLDHFVGGPAPMPSTEPDTSFPLSLDDARPDKFPGWRFLRIYAGGYAPYGVRIWIGPRASAEDVDLAREVVASLDLHASWAEP